MARTPTDPTKAQVWITKGLDDLDFEFYFPQGPKGDPGGIAYGTALDAANLNDIVTSGVYRTTATSSLSALDNYPVTLAGVLVVHERLRDAATYQSVFQEYFVADSVNGARVRYLRYLYGKTSWTPWRTYVSQRVDQTAGRAIYTWDDLNKREQLIYGDTGARSIGDLLINGWSTSATNLIVQRTNQVVTISGQLSSTAATDPILFQLPNGFRPKTVNAHPINVQISEGSSKWGYCRWDGTIKIDITAKAGVLLVSGAWTTPDVWPTTLPGIANGTVPNL